MKFYLDCEFNGFGGELISLALVSEDLEKRFYKVLPYEHMQLDPWVAKHVIPVLHRKPTSSRSAFSNDLSHFLLEYAVKNEITIVADWPEDIRYLCESLIIGPGRMVNSPNITFILDRVTLVNTANYSLVPHNALEDAIALARGASS